MTRKLFALLSLILFGFTVGLAQAAGPNNGSNNPAKCKSATNPKCKPISPSM